MKNKLYSLLKFLIGWPLSIVALFFIAKLIAPQKDMLLASIGNLNPALLTYGIISFVIFYFIRSYIWYRLIKNLGHDISFKSSSYIWSISELKRYIPGNIWSFLGRTVLFSEKGVSKKEIGKSLIIEAELFVLGCAIISILSLPFILPGFKLQFDTLSGFAVISIMTLVVAVFCLINSKSEYRISKSETNTNDKNHKTQNVLNFKNFVLRISNFLFPPYPPTENLLLVLLSTAALFFFGLGNYFVIGSYVPLHPQMVLELTGFFVLSFLAGYLSILTPAGFGVREGIVIFGLTKVTTPAIAAFASVFSRIILILSELIFIALALVWYKLAKLEYRISKSETNTNDKNHKTQNVLNFKNLNFDIVSNFVLRISNLEKLAATHPHELIVAFLATLYTIYISTASFLRYDSYHTGRFDLGNMAQTVWNTMHGRIFLFTNPDSVEPISRLAFHADFILVLLAPFYALWTNPKMLLLIQTAVIAAGAFFVYLISKEVLKSKNISLAFAFAYLINPSVLRANLYDFHAVVLATTFFLATYYFYLKKRYVLFIVMAILAAICKEQLWVIIALFGGLLIIHRKKYLLGSTVVVASLGIFYALVWHVMPTMLGSHHFALSFYADLGDGPSGVIKSLIFSPDKIFGIVTEHSKVEYLKQLFSPLGYLSLLAPIFLIFAGPDLAINLLSSNANFQQIYYQYTATITPFLFIAGIWGAWVAMRLAVSGWLFVTKKTNRQVPTAISFIIIIYLLTSSLNAAYKMGPLPGSERPVLEMFKPLQERAYVDEYLAQIPEDYAVAASNNLGSHLSQREHIYVVPHGIDRADIIVFLLSDRWSLQRDTELVTKLQLDPNYELIAQHNRFFAFKRKAN